MRNLFYKILNKLYNPIYIRIHAVANGQIYARENNDINKALSRAAANIALRNIDETNPLSWEFSGFSQNGEDGILDFLWTKLKSQNRYFIEIGAANGIDNNTAWFAHAKKFSGLMIDGHNDSIIRAKKHATFGTECLNLFINEENIIALKEKIVHTNPDIFSLDIDGNDYYVAKSILNNGIRPKIFIVEYNSVFGPNESVTIEYDPLFDIDKAHATHLYYGVSITGWKTFFGNQGYQFVTVDSNGVNAVFVDKKEFDMSFLENLKSVNFKENFHQLNVFKCNWEKQLELIKEKKTITIS